MMPRYVAPGFLAARRVDQLGTELVFQVAEEAQALAARGRTVYPFHMGELDFDTPPNIVEVCAKALRDGKTKYTPNGGLPELREALAADVGRERDVVYGPQNVAIQPAGKPVIGKFLLALMDPGDEVLYPNPGFPIYSSLIEFFGGVAVPYGYVEEPEGFRIDLEDLERRITSRTRLLILNDHHNPTGAGCTEAEMERLAELVLKHDLFVLSDEAYFAIRYSGRSLSLVSQPEMQDRTVILYTFGKKYAMTGFRLGWAAGPEKILAAMTKIHQYTLMCAPVTSQMAGREAMRNGAKVVQEMKREYNRRRNFIVASLNELGMECHMPQGAFYAFPSIKGLRMSSMDFARELLEQQKVALVPGQAFGSECADHVRISYASSYDNLREAVARIKIYLEFRRGKK